MGNAAFGAPGWLFLGLTASLAIAVAAYVLCRSRAIALAGDEPRMLHSRPGHHGAVGVLTALSPALVLLLAAAVLAKPLAVAEVRGRLANVVDETVGGVTASDIRRPILMRRLIDEALKTAGEAPERVPEGLKSLIASGADGASPDREAFLRAFKRAPDRAARAQDLLNLLEDRRPPLYDRVLSDAREIAAGRRPAVRNDPFRAAAAEIYARRAGLVKAGGAGAAILAALFGAVFARRSVRADKRARNQFEGFLKICMIACSTVAILTTFGIVFSLIASAMRFFIEDVPPWEFFFGLHWSPLNLAEGEAAAGSGLFGAVPLFTGTLLITAIAMAVAAPIGLLSAIFLSEYADRRVRDSVKPILEILAGVPTVVYGFFALLTVGPAIREGVEAVSLWTGVPIDVSTKSALSAGVVMGVMIVPFISSLADDVINAAPRSLRDGAYGMGATRSETVMRVILPAALPGVVGAFLLAFSRAIGETMIVVMAVGRAANLTADPLDLVTTITVQIVALLTGDNEFGTAITRSAFALGVTLFGLTLALNVVALRIVQKYREKYD